MALNDLGDTEQFECNHLVVIFAAREKVDMGRI